MLVGSVRAAWRALPVFGVIFVTGALVPGCGGQSDDADLDAHERCGDAIFSRSATVKVMTLNLRHDEDQWRRRFELVADEIARLEPDIIGLQEVEIDVQQAPALNELVASRGKRRYQIYQETKPAGGEGVAIMTRFPILWHDHLPMRDNRVSVFVRVRHPSGSDIDVVDTHLSVGTESTVMSARVEQALDTVRLANRNLACNPTFFTGDLNSGERELPLERLKEAGFVDSYAFLHGSPTPLDGNTSDLVLADGAFEQHPQERIDFVLSRGAGQCSVSPVKSEVCFRNHDDKGFYPSDHFGVMTTFAVRLR
ncbi:endonuclease/exonuclease/phosphatase family protein [Labilithrix luteola]|nr:endonuclease/exonuclease/phosphatase family protein [Labilithrix luteola]